MSINLLGLGHSAMHAQKPASAPSGQAAASSAADSITNTGSVSADTMGSFFQSLSANLQSMLSQGGTGAQTAANQPMSGAHHRHHHSEGGSPHGVASQTMAQIGHGNGSDSSAAGGMSQSASSASASVMQALRAYGATASA